jgi:predicted deacylase
VSLLTLAGPPSNRALAKATDSDPEIRPGPGVTAIKKLSDYLPSLTNTPGDTFIYFLDSKEPGGTAFVAGGTHPNEIAGVMAATVLIEHAKVQKGRLIVIGHANNSAASYPDPARQVPSSYTLKTASGTRHFRYGARLTKPGDQGENDPIKFRHPSSSEDLEGYEARNLDRAYPGRADGNLTERMAWAILRVLKTESVDIAYDLHESPPDSRLARMIVSHPKSLDIAALAILDLDASGVGMKLERSSETFRGLSHREWGDATKAHSFLFETPHPGMVRNTTGVDVVNDPKYPLAQRVGLHLSSLLAILDAYNSTVAPAVSVKVQEVPGLPQLTKSGLGPFLK